MIVADRLVKTFASTDSQSPVHAVDDVSLRIAEGEIFGIVGQSGAGKSTLVRLLNLLERPDSGSVILDGTDLTALDERALRRERHQIGMIFQQFQLLSRRTVRENVALPLEVLGVPARERRARVDEILDLVGLTDRADAYPAQLSGGQKQRVGIARALAPRPRVLLSDEATSALDPATTRSILDLLAKLNRELGLTIVLITHEMEVIKQVCHSAALIEHGRIVEQGRIHDLLQTPGSRIAHQLFPLGEHAPERGNTIVEVTFTGLDSSRPVIARLARDHGLDISILGAMIETVSGEQTGRIRLELPGTETAKTAAIESLRAEGYVVDVVAANGGAA